MNTLLPNFVDIPPNIIQTFAMNLFLVPDNPEHTVLVSADGTAYYEVSTYKALDGTRISQIIHPRKTEESRLIAEIEWKTWRAPTIVRSPLLGGMARCARTGLGMRATDFLMKRHRFSSTCYFLGDDDEIYRWKFVKGVGFVLTKCTTNEEVARYTNTPTGHGLFAGEKKTRLTIQPGCLHRDLIVLSFIIMEKKRRDHAGDGTRLIAHDEDPQGDGGGEGGEA